MDPNTHIQRPVRITKEADDKFKKIRETYHQSFTARVAYLIDKDIQENEKLLNQ